MPPIELQGVEPDTLQLCPWFLDYGMKSEVQFQSQLEPGKIGTMIAKLKLDELATWVFYTPIDLFQLFDKVMVHEVRMPPPLFKTQRAYLQFHN